MPKSPYFWVFVCLFAISALDGLRGALRSQARFQQSEDALNEQQKLAYLERLSRGQLRLQAGEMISVNDASRFHSGSLVQAIERIPGYQMAPNFIWQDRSGAAFAFAARGVDKNYHFANSFMTGFVPFVTEKVWVPLATLAQRKSYQLDHLRYGRKWTDVWQNSEQAYLNTHGDCEDHAIILADWLVGLGYDARVVLGELPEGGHAWVLLRYEGAEYVLEATSKRRPRSIMDFKLARYASEYRPRFMFNRDTFWENTGTSFTTRYSGSNWRIQSRFKSHRQSQSVKPVARVSG